MNRRYAVVFLCLFLFSILYKSVWAESFDFQLVPRTTKSGSSDGYFTKIPLEPLPVKKGKLNFFKQSGWDYISFEGDYDEKTGELKGVFTGATANNTPNSGGSYYCEFTAQIKKGDKNTTLKYYPDHGSAETLNHCYAQVVFDFEKNRRAPRDDWWPDDLIFDIQPLESDGLEDSGVRFSDIAGQVEVLLPTGYDADGEPIFDDEEGWNHAKLDMELPYGAKVRLDYKSRIILSMPDMTTYEMKTSDNPNDPVVEIILPRKNKGDNVLKLMGGQLWSNVKKMIKDGSMDIEMGQAVAGIKGTTFVLHETKAESKLAVLEGEVEFRSKTSGDKVVVTAGEQIAATSAGLGTTEDFDVSTEQRRWQNIDYPVPKIKTSESGSLNASKNDNNQSVNQPDNKGPKSTLLQGSVLIISLAAIIGLGLLIATRTTRKRNQNQT